MTRFSEIGIVSPISQRESIGTIEFMNNAGVRPDKLSEARVGGKTDPPTQWHGGGDRVLRACRQRQV